MSFRRDFISKPIFSWARGVLPAMSDTEREALEAGDVWWDADLFTGNPDWSKLLAVAPATLTEEEKAFLNGPVDELCAMLDEWKINWEWRDLPPEAWAFIKRHKFFGMIIPKEFGGLGFSPYAHSEVVRKLSSRSLTAAVTVMVPNSLGPGELLMRFGTKEQQDRWLPRLAEGTDIPCFGLTSPEAGSDAASMVDTGIICKGNFEGREVLGLRLNWHKRYITLGPVATLLGLAFKAYDPDHLVGQQEDLGITVALIPTHLPGVEIGRRHLPAMQVFQNGPNWGRDVFIPMDYIIGGQERLGQGWKMLMTALAAGRGISLPSLSAAGAAYAARTTGAYARIREQFGISIGKFEGIEEPLARIAGTAYLLDAARRLTCAALNQGHHPAVISGIMKLHATERMRIAIDDAMDIHGGKAVIDGPQNYLGNLYRSVPVGITVEGANILTRNLIVFGQGAIRAHPFLLDEMNALGEADRAKGLDAFDKAFWNHVGHSFKTMFRAWGRSWSGGLFAPAPDAGEATRFYRQLSRYSSAFALVRRHGAADAGRRAQAQGNALGPVRRHPVRTLSVVGRAEALAGRGTAAGRFRRARMVHGERLPHHRKPLCRNPRQPAEPVRGGDPEIPDPAVRRKGDRPVRPRRASMRAARAGAVGGARPADGGSVACRRRWRRRPAGKGVPAGHGGGRYFQADARRAPA